MWTSVPQMVVVVMRMSASSGPTSGIGLEHDAAGFYEDGSFHFRRHGRTPLKGCANLICLFVRERAARCVDADHGRLLARQRSCRGCMAGALSPQTGRDDQLIF
jgi:hypothetical protein